MVKINNLKVDFGDFTALNIKQPIEFKTGERIGIVGSNGAGKTTLINSILGLVSYKGNISRNVDFKEIAVHMQLNEYVDTMSCKSIMEAILDTKLEKDNKLKELVEYFEMQEHLKKKYKNLSGGQKQRFTLIMVLYKDAKLTFFDEVTSGLDFETRERLMEKINSFYKGKDSTVVIVSHYYEELEKLTDKILLLDKGQVIDFGTKEELFKKYCGNTVYIVDANEKNATAVSDFRRIKSPDNLIALSTKDVEEESTIADILIREGIDFRRSSNDIEIMTINAKEQFYNGGRR